MRVTWKRFICAGLWLWLDSRKKWNGRENISVKVYIKNAARAERITLWNFICRFEASLLASTELNSTILLVTTIIVSSVSHQHGKRLICRSIFIMNQSVSDRRPCCRCGSWALVRHCHCQLMAIASSEVKQNIEILRVYENVTRKCQCSNLHTPEYPHR